MVRSVRSSLRFIFPFLLFCVFSATCQKWELQKLASGLQKAAKLRFVSQEKQKENGPGVIQRLQEIRRHTKKEEDDEEWEEQLRQRREQLERERQKKEEKRREEEKEWQQKRAEKLKPQGAQQRQGPPSGGAITQEQVQQQRQKLKNVPKQREEPESQQKRGNPFLIQENPLEERTKGLAEWLQNAPKKGVPVNNENIQTALENLKQGNDLKLEKDSVINTVYMRALYLLTTRYKSYIDSKDEIDVIVRHLVSKDQQNPQSDLRDGHNELYQAFHEYIKKQISDLVKEIQQMKQNLENQPPSWRATLREKEEKVDRLYLHEKTVKNSLREIEEGDDDDDW